MSYLTIYNLDWDQPVPSRNELETLITNLREPPETSHNSPETNLQSTRMVLSGQEEDSWYQYSQHMTIVSLTWPQTLFTLSGAGETRDDYWKTHYQAGRSHTLMAEMIFPAYDPSELASSPVLSGQHTSMEEQFQALDQDFSTQLPKEEAKLEEAKRIFRSIYGHAPPGTVIRHTGEDYIAIVAGHYPGGHMTMFITDINTVSIFSPTSMRNQPPGPSWAPGTFPTNRPSRTSAP